MRWIVLVLVAAVALAGVIAATVVPASQPADEVAAPIYGIALPAGYRDWRLISVAHVGDPLNDLRAKLGNDVAIKAYREGSRPFPDGTIIVRLASRAVTSDEDNKAVGPPLERRMEKGAAERLLANTFMPGPATNVQFMVKDSKKYASTGGWGFAQFDDGKPASEAVHKTCFACHEPAKDRDFVFTRYAP